MPSEESSAPAEFSVESPAVQWRVRPFGGYSAGDNPVNLPMGSDLSRPDRVVRRARSSVRVSPGSRRTHSRTSCMGASSGPALEASPPFGDRGLRWRNHRRPRFCPAGWGAVDAEWDRGKKADGEQPISRRARTAAKRAPATVRVRIHHGIRFAARGGRGSGRARVRSRADVAAPSRVGGFVVPAYDPAIATRRAPRPLEGEGALNPKPRVSTPSANRPQPIVERETSVERRIGLSHGGLGEVEGRFDAVLTG